MSTTSRSASRRRTVASGALALVAAALALTACGDATKPAAPQARNAIVILADDLGVADVSAYFPDRIPTPNIDRIARGGVRFDAGYATAAMCSPSRRCWSMPWLEASMARWDTPSRASVARSSCS